MKFLSFLVSRIGKALVVVLGVVIINFFLIRLAPGDPAAVLAGQAGAGDAAYVEQLRAAFGLDQPLLTQLMLYLKGVAQLDLGFSYRNHVPVLDLIVERLPATFLLMSCAFVFSIVLGVLLGVVAAKARYRNKRRWIDSSVMTGALLLYATPLFWLSLMGILLFSVVLGWLPAFGMETVGAGLTGWARAGDIAQHLVLPTVTLGCFFMAVYVRLTRASMLEVIGMDFVKTARAKGVGPARDPRPRAAQRAAAGHHLRGHPAGPDGRRRGADRDRVRLARHRPADVRRPVAARLSAAAGHFPGHFHHGGGLQPAHRRAVPAHRSAHRRGAQQEPPHEILRAPLYAQSWRGGRPGHRAAGGGPLAAPLLYEESPWMMVADPLIPPFTNADYPFGTDMLGRDITAGLVWGARVSLLVGLLSTAVALGFGIVVGAIAGYCGGRIDDALMRFTEFFQTIPQLAMAVVLVAIIGPSVYSIMGAIALVSWPPAARLVRSEFMTLKQREFVQAAIVIGQAPARIVGTQILPNAMSPIIVSASFMVATAILTESSLSFLGLGDRNEMSWGFMIGAARTMIREAWWMSVWPGVAILLTVLAINLIGEGLNDALNPQLRKRGE